MGATPTKSLIKWITARLADINEASADQPGGITKMELYHQVEDGSGMGTAKPCQAFHIQNGANPLELAQQVWEAAETEAEVSAMGTRQLFELYAYRGGSNEPEARFPFNLYGRASLDTAESGSLLTEPPTDRGHQGQMMRQNESMHLMMVRSQEAMQGRMIQEIGRLTELCRHLEDRQMAVLSLHEDLLDRKQQREFEAAREVSKEKRNQDWMDMVKTLAPLIAAKWLGSGETEKKELPASNGTASGGTPTNGAAKAESNGSNGHSHVRANGNGIGSYSDSLLKKFLDRITVPEQQRIMNALQGMHRLVFQEIWKSYKDDSISGMPEHLRDLTIRSFLASLTAEEAEGIFAAFTEENSQFFRQIYNYYAAEHEKEQSRRPEIFRNL